MSDDGEDDKKVVLFGRDLASIPCFRNSFLYGISGGIGTGLVYFMFTSRTRMACHVGFSGFMGITMSYWFYCRYNFSKTRFQMNQLQTAMQKQAMYEGTSSGKEMPLSSQQVER